MKFSYFFGNYIPALTERAALRDFTQALEGLGLWGVTAVDHITYPWPTADGNTRMNIDSPFHTPTNSFPEILTYLAAVAMCTETLRLRTGILVLPQREPLLVAKQVASIDHLSGGRVELGVGIGWIEDEFQALGAPFHKRGKRMDESLEVLKRAWTEDHISFQGEFFQIDDMSMYPKPVQEPGRMLWLAGGDMGKLEPAMRRLGRYGAGWVVNWGTPKDWIREGVELAKQEARAAGRGEVEFGIEMMIGLVGDNWLERAVRRVEACRELGATHINLATWLPELKTVDDHLSRVRAFIEAVPAEYRE